VLVVFVLVVSVAVDGDVLMPVAVVGDQKKSKVSVLTAQLVSVTVSVISG